jgi:hypothetical protein
MDYSRITNGHNDDNIQSESADCLLSLWVLFKKHTCICFIQTKLYENLLPRRQWLVIQKCLYCLRIVYKAKWAIGDEDPYFGFKFICWENRSRYELYYTYEGGQRIEYDSGCQMQSMWFYFSFYNSDRPIGIWQNSNT